jgi:hypothetical protein
MSIRRRNKTTTQRGMRSSVSWTTRGRDVDAPPELLVAPARTLNGALT